MHSDGYIKVRDRSKDIIISGGENVSSLEIEDALHRHPAVLLAAVVAQPDSKWGETPCAFVELRTDTQPSGPRHASMPSEASSRSMLHAMTSRLSPRKTTANGDETLGLRRLIAGAKNRDSVDQVDHAS